MTAHLPGGDPEPDRKEKQMSERVAIVTGAGGELGRATAAKLAAAGDGEDRGWSRRYVVP